MVIIGDSLTEGYGVSRAQSYPTLLQAKIKTAGLKWDVINSGISGSTSASASSRVKWHLKQKPDLIVLALGANDGLRGTSVKAMRGNLEAGIDLSKKAGVKTILVGIRMPPNYGAAYTKEFEAAFKQVADKTKVRLIPFLLLDVAGKKELNLTDGIHPNEKGHAIIAETMFQALKADL
ncbi:MAG TPA: arylesterase [Bdellovibrionales bacterium]|nr:arylesterase [Bdellovibrionales bacterium]